METLPLCTGESGTPHRRLWHSALNTLVLHPALSTSQYRFCNTYCALEKVALCTEGGGGRKDRMEGWWEGRNALHSPAGYSAIPHWRFCHSAMEALPVRTGRASIAARLCHSTVETLHCRLLQSARETLAFCTGDSGALNQIVRYYCLHCVKRFCNMYSAL